MCPSAPQSMQRTCWPEARIIIVTGPYYLGITIPPICTKILETAVYRRLAFVNNAFDKVDDSK